MKFEAGDLIRCVDNEYYEHQLTQGKTYKVIDCTDKWIYIDCCMAGGWNPNRFEIVKEEVSMHKFKVGDVVKVTGSEDDNHRKWNGAEGFNNTWACVMDNFIGKVCKVTSIAAYGIALTGCGDYRFPPQALELFY